jgi:hypothetical protein
VKGTGYATGVSPGAGGWSVAVEHLGFVKLYGQRQQ